MKKKISSLLAVSAIGLGVFAGGASAASNAEQSGPDGSTGYSVETDSAVNGQGASTTGYQSQAGKTSGEATFRQSIRSNLTLNGSSSKTEVNGNTTQETSTTQPTHVVQNQVDHSAAIQYEKTTKSGKTYNFQQVHRTSINYSVGVNSVNP